MIPATHLCTAFVAGCALRAGFDDEGPRRGAWRDPLVWAALVGSVSPDWDLLPALLFESSLSAFHRGATHSPVGVVLQALLVAALYRALRSRLEVRLGGAGWWPSSRALGCAFGVGMSIHAFQDWLNPWGIAIAWPATRAGYSLNTLHEGDVVALAISGLAALLALWRWPIAVGVLTVGFSAWISTQAWALQNAQVRAQQIASEGGQAAAYPHPWPSCSALIVSRIEYFFSAECAAHWPAGGFAPVKVANASQEPRAWRSADATAESADFRNKRPFAFPELHQRPDGSALVIWRDMRELLLEDAGEEAYGIYIELDPNGKILSVRKRWMLKLLF